MDYTILDNLKAISDILQKIDDSLEKMHISQTNIENILVEAQAEAKNK